MGLSARLEMSAGVDSGLDAQPAQAQGSLPWGRLDWLAVVVIIAFSAGVPLLIARVTGALGIPRNDSWSYSRIALTWVRTGNLHFLGWNDQTLVGQLVVARPFLLLSDHQETLQCLTSVLGALGLVAVFVLARPIVGRRWALLAGCLVASAPLWPSLAASFMSDVPGFAFAMVSLAFARAVPSRKKIVPISLAAAASLFFGLLAFMTRQPLASVLVVVGVTILWRARDRRQSGLFRVALVVLVAVAAAAATVLYLWRAGLPNAGMSVSGPAGAALRTVVRSGLSFGLTLSLLSAPVVFFCRPVTLVRQLVVERPRRIATAAAVPLLAFVVLSATGGSSVLLGNYVTQYGSYRGTVQGHVLPIVPGPIWLTLMVATIPVAAVEILFVWSAVEHWRSWSAELGQLASFSAIYLLLTLVAAGLGRPPFDRYLLPLLPGLIVLVLSARPDSAGKPGARGGWAKQLGLGTVGLTWVLIAVFFGTDSGLYDATRWVAAQRLVSLTGLPASRIDGGFEWVGSHATPVGVHSQPGASWYSEKFSTVPECMVVVANASGPILASYRLLWEGETFGYRELTGCRFP